ncbi:NAD(P)-binding protein [Xylariaceae sp. FL0594]|nr:NAD(P)-binding protein [Xylariaceae sp. FL0594]
MPINPPFPSPTKRWHNTAQPSASPTLPSLSSRGKSVLITGGGSTGIGGETARYFAAAGASRIALLGRRQGPLLDNKAYIEKTYPGVEVAVFTADVTRESDVENAFAAFAAGAKSKGENEDGKIDVLVHSAASIGPSEPASIAPVSEYLDAITANIAGAFHVARSFVRHTSSEGAVAVAINSWGSYLSLNEAFSSYSVAKMAVYRLWDTIAVAHPHILVFHTQPGVVLTEMNLRTGGAESFENVPIDDGALSNRKFLWCNWDIDELKDRASEIGEGTELNISLVGWPRSSKEC